jgi:hypothetical protein
VPSWAVRGRLPEDVRGLKKKYPVLYKGVAFFVHIGSLRSLVSTGLATVPAQNVDGRRRIQGFEEKPLCLRGLYFTIRKLINRDATSAEIELLVSGKR